MSETDGEGELQSREENRIHRDALLRRIKLSEAAHEIPHMSHLFSNDPVDFVDVRLA